MASHWNAHSEYPPSGPTLIHSHAFEARGSSGKAEGWCHCFHPFIQFLHINKHASIQNGKVVGPGDVKEVLVSTIDQYQGV
jgi:hypothetical protein